MGRSEYDDEDSTVIIERRSAGAGSFLMGMAIGAGLAMLLTPQSGPELRRTLRQQARRAKRAAGDVTRDVRDRAEHVLEDARSEIEARVDDARTLVDRKRRDLTRAVDAGRTAARDARESFERRLAQSRATDADEVAEDTED